MSIVRHFAVSPIHSCAGHQPEYLLCRLQVCYEARSHLDTARSQNCQQHRNILLYSGSIFQKHVKLIIWCSLCGVNLCTVLQYQAWTYVCHRPLLLLMCVEQLHTSVQLHVCAAYTLSCPANILPLCVDPDCQSISHVICSYLQQPFSGSPI